MIINDYTNEQDALSHYNNLCEAGKYAVMCVDYEDSNNYLVIYEL